MSDPRSVVLQDVWDLGDQLDSNHTRWAVAQVAEKHGVDIRIHNDFSDPPRNRNEERIAKLERERDRLDVPRLARALANSERGAESVDLHGLWPSERDAAQDVAKWYARLPATPVALSEGNEAPEVATEPKP